ncbi:MAG: hypothetical protein IPP33_06115 [Flavobacteriales bacterium]|nr:hypothetical protein [Flavobacteriales bacterium]
MGGTQDNGTIFLSGSGNTDPEGHGPVGSGGDGFDCDLSTDGCWYHAAASMVGLIFRSNDAGNFGPFYDNNVPVSTDPDVLGVGLGDFYTNFRFL